MTLLTKYKGKVTLNELKEMPYGDVHILYVDFYNTAVQQEEQRRKEEAMSKQKSKKMVHEAGSGVDSNLTSMNSELLEEAVEELIEP